METLYTQTKRIDCLAPHSNFFQQLGQDYVTQYISERNSRGIITRNLWEGAVDQKIVKDYYKNASIRLLPAKMKERFQTTLFLYDDKALYISSLKNAYALLMTSKEHHDFMAAVFDGLWDSSTPHPQEKTRQNNPH